MERLARRRACDREPHAQAGSGKHLGRVEPGPAATPVGHEHGAVDGLGRADRRQSIDHQDVGRCGQRGQVRGCPGGHDHAIDRADQLVSGIDAPAELELDAVLLEAPQPVVGEAADGLLVRRRRARERELAADRGVRVHKCDVCMALGGTDGGRQARRSRADHEDVRALLARRSRGDVPLAAGPRVLQAADRQAQVVAPDAALVAAGAEDPLALAAFDELARQLRICDQASVHADRVGGSGGDQVLRLRRLVHARRDDQRDAEILSQQQAVRPHRVAVDRWRRHDPARAEIAR